MNEQLVVKNFGPIKDTEVIFKRVTVFIGPTGGGKSTLAKLAAIFHSGMVILQKTNVTIDDALALYNLAKFKNIAHSLTWRKESGASFTMDDEGDLDIIINDVYSSRSELRISYRQSYKLVL